ncbi:threonine aldolase family protein [Rufibacter sediminis]|uniref:Aminotransferase class I/II-fold pyridoxal phosphate-dependent enzyme n=1 Tax=Rufibacter sediminis TaxID=2762756 RepID=A0ABR6VVU1_9BACT|nr:aminotransferase class I/II-fold pyridoxal phosphate-dependent enzyme [Rufibacter sediminis]MBC3541012.1 aminotransferase class I/II-fold pyridoxal phosphate-dependent enzyme [Rufibacter sediminis]
MLYSFTNDYSEGCHPNILQRLTETNLTQQAGYGNDAFTLESVAAIKQLCQRPEVDVHLVAGGTLANLIVLGAFLKTYESVIAAETGHINQHEAGAIEATGHKIETVATPDGKLRPEAIRPLINKFPEYHTVKPRIVYISNSTEIGTIYTKRELEELSEFCRQNNLLLYMDGARMAMALTAQGNDLTLADIAALTDIFYLGATKCGGLIGEAIVLANVSLQKDFKYYIKQRGALMAKGRLFGMQFAELLRDNLMFELAGHANAMAQRMASQLQRLGYSFLTQSQTNQIFPILPDALITELSKKYGFFVWRKMPEGTSAIRLITSWATPQEQVDQFLQEVTDLSERLK